MKRHIFTLGVGWFALQCVWTAYNAFMPIFYQQFTANLALVGIFMTFDNIAALTLQPFWGARSDLTRTSFGRRKPFLLIGMPLAAIATLILPFFSDIGLIALIGGAIVMNLCMTIFRAPLLSLFSDLFEPKMRTRVSGITDLMAGIGAIVMLLGGGALFDVDKHFPFALASGILLIAVVVIYVGIKEPPAPDLSKPAAGDMPVGIIPAVRTLFLIPQKSPLWFMLAIFFFWTAWNGIESFWTTFATKTLEMSVGTAANFAAILALSYLVGAVPSGIAASYFGRQRMIIIGLVLLVPLYLIGAFNRSVEAYAVLLGVIGIVWSMVLVNSPILFQEFASVRQVGLFSGLYAIGASAAQIVGPPSYGALMTQFGPQALWFTGCIAVLLGAVCISQVREGQVVVPEEIQATYSNPI